MAKLYASLLTLTLTTSFALGAPLPSYSHGLDYLEAREPSFFSGIGHAFKDVGNVAKKTFHVAENVAQNPIVQLAASAIPGEAEIAAAGKVVGALGKVKKFEKAAKIVKKVDKRLGGAKKVVNRAKQVHKVAKHVAPPSHNSGRHTAQHGRHHRRDLDAEELSEREYDDFLAERDFFDDLD